MSEVIISLVVRAQIKCDTDETTLNSQSTVSDSSLPVMPTLVI